MVWTEGKKVIWIPPSTKEALEKEIMRRGWEKKFKSWNEFLQEIIRILQEGKV